MNRFVTYIREHPRIITWPVAFFIGFLTSRLIRIENVIPEYQIRETILWYGMVVTLIILLLIVIPLGLLKLAELIEG